ncbi:hypothetical protein BJV82DRAFT_661786 [Fennellomyces sp. T-0311]|nr:hypothetical protein BJV82DRAFT_661786 [Fennellomyces sp. T-0311]
MALFKTYSVPTISKILHATGEFGKDTARRAEDTGLILGEALDTYAHLEAMRQKNPNLSQEKIEKQRQRPIDAITRLNEIHGKYPILNGDYLYTLSLFITQPIKWIDKYGYRKLEPIEKNALFRIWYDIGTRMNIKDIPTTLEAMFEFHDNYARDNVKYAPTNWKVAKPTVDHLLSIYPKFAESMALGVIPAILDPIDVKGFGLNPPKPLTLKLVVNALHTSAYIIRHFKLPRFSFVMRTPVEADPKNNRYKPLFDIYKPVYPDGYCIFELGPQKYKPAKCPIMH